MDQVPRLPRVARHRGKIVNVQGMLIERLEAAGKKWHYPWGNLKWAIGKELDMHIYPPERIEIG